MSARRAALLVSFAFAATAPSSAAQFRLAKGIVYSHSNGYHVVVADLDSPAVEVRVAQPHATPQENKLTVERHAREEGAVVAINANYFGGPLNYPCGAARGFGAQYPGAYGEAGNCVTTMGWARGKGALFGSAGRHADARLAPQFTELATGGGLLLAGGQPRDWNRAKLEEGRSCTAIGLSANRKKFIMVVSDARACTGKGLQEALLAHGAADAIHLDGGGSSKMWIRGRGYVNDVREDRAPSVVILARPNGQCPSDCGLSRCVQLPRPFRAQCVGRPCRAGLAGIWNCDETLRRRARCENGRVVTQTCAQACLPKAWGTEDACNGGGGCPAGNGLYCGGNLVIGDRDTLYRCTDGHLSEVKRCPGRCRAKPAGVNDRCE